MIRLPVVPLAVAFVLVAGCGETGRHLAASSPTTSTAEPAADVSAVVTITRPRRAARRGKKVTVLKSQFGTILGDGRGEAFYSFSKEKNTKSACYSACARAWPPVLTKGRPAAGEGVRKGLLGTTRRRNGMRQVTYRGQPLYYYVADSPGRVLCHNVREFGGLWRVIKPDGTPVH